MPFSRRDFLASSAAALGAGVLGRPALARAWQQQTPQPTPQQTPQAPQWTPVFTEIRGGVGQFLGRGGTIGYLINAGGVVVVDSQYPDSAKACVAGINERSKNRPVDRLINTHHHADHSAGNIAFKGLAKKVVSTEFAAGLIKQAAAAPNATENLAPDSTFTDSWREQIGNEWVRAKWYGRAHTGGDAVITFERANVAHMGDLMFNRRIPVIDRVNGALVANWVGVIEKAAADHPADTIYIFGHAGMGHPVTGARAELMFFRDYLTALLDHTRAAVKAGQTREQFTATTPTLTGFEVFGAHRANTLGILYDEITEK
ncbi:MAG TPA: MBL fold metallo-hydrolase [Vicinamibacterales bacterium]|nr:MBL fold metallo-hydrolase [Vicinamibacterales bacterium]